MTSRLGAVSFYYLILGYILRSFIVRNLNSDEGVVEKEEEKLRILVKTIDLYFLWYMVDGFFFFSLRNWNVYLV